MTFATVGLGRLGSSRWVLPCQGRGMSDDSCSSDDEEEEEPPFAMKHTNTISLPHSCI